MYVPPVLLWRQDYTAQPAKAKSRTAWQAQVETALPRDGLLGALDHVLRIDRRRGRAAARTTLGVQTAASETAPPHALAVELQQVEGEQEHRTRVAKARSDSNQRGARDRAAGQAC